MKKSLFITLVTIFHFLISVGAFLAVFSYGMNQFETGDPVGFIERVLKFISNALFFPLFYPLVHWAPKSLIKPFSGIFGYIPMFLNSLIWGYCFWYIFNRLKKGTGNGAV